MSKDRLRILSEAKQFSDNLVKKYGYGTYTDIGAAHIAAEAYEYAYNAGLKDGKAGKGESRFKDLDLAPIHEELDRDAQPKEEKPTYSATEFDGWTSFQDDGPKRVYNNDKSRFQGDGKDAWGNLIPKECVSHHPGFTLDKTTTTEKVFLPGTPIYIPKEVTTEQAHCIYCKKYLFTVKGKT